MKRILYITAFNPSKEDAGSNYTRQLLGELGKKNKIDLIVFHSSKAQLYTPTCDNIRVVKTFVISNFSRIFGVLSLPLFFPLFVSRFSWSRLSEIKGIARSNCYDYIYYDFSQVFVYSLFLKNSKPIFMAHDVIAQKYERRGFFPKWAKWTEGKIYKHSHNVYTFSFKDCNLLHSLYNIKSTPTSFFIQPEAIEANPSRTEQQPYFVFYGAWVRNVNYESLEWFIDNVIPHLSSDINFKIIGKGLPESIVKKLGILKNVEQLGFVDNPYQILADAQALISPLHDGAGVKVKVIESLACGTPVIGTELSFEGIDEEYKDFMFVAETPLQYIDCLCNFNVSITKKISFKERFLSSYNRKPILELLN